jgi:hypothetical protein
MTATPPAQLMRYAPVSQRIDTLLIENGDGGIDIAPVAVGERTNGDPRPIRDQHSHKLSFPCANGIDFLAECGRTEKHIGRDHRFVGCRPNLQMPEGGMRRVSPSLLLLPFLLAGCAAQVSHPSKSTAEMRADIDLCTDEANRKYWMDPIAALYNAYDCLEAKGYRRGKGDMAAQVERALGEAPARRSEQEKKAQPAMPCKVPCKPRR